MRERGLGADRDKDGAVGHRGVATLHHDPEAGSGQSEPRRRRCSQATPGPLDDDPGGAGMPRLQQGAREEPLDRLVALGLLDDRHLGRPGPTYTVDTLRDLQSALSAEHPDATLEWFFITGADALADIVGWRDPDGILAQAHLIGVTRPGHVLKDPGLPTGTATLVEVPALAISSTDVRARVKRGEPIRYLVPDGVAHLIAKHDLYAAP